MAEDVKKTDTEVSNTDVAAATPPTTPTAQEQDMVGITRDLPSSQAPAVNKKPAAEPAPENDAPANLSTVNSKMCTTLNNAWGIGAFDTSMLSNYVHGDDIKLKTNGGVKFKLLNGDNLDWKINARSDGSQYESITMDRGHFGMRKMTQEGADAMVAIALTKGWESINVVSENGIFSQDSKKGIENKEMMWLAAQTMGLAVNNFEPLPDSKVWDKLKERNPDRYAELSRKDQGMIGITNEAPETASPAASSKFAPPKQDTVEAKAPEAPAKPTFNQWLDTRAAEAKSPTEAEGFKIMSRAVKSGAIQLDEIEEKSIQTKYKPKVREGVMEADGKGYNRVVEVFAAKGVTAPQKVPEQEIIAAAPKASAPSSPKV